ncbi:MAG: hypothetical protein LBC46_05945, partial [Treponema sp.]|nr:hypothetical protein [Treponema sp.]
MKKVYSFPRGGILFEDSTVTPISTFYDDSWRRSVPAFFINIARKGLDVFKAPVVAQRDPVFQTTQPMLKSAN